MAEIKFHKILIILAIIALFSTAVYAQEKYKYRANIDPHTRYNNQLDDCYYYYGYGSCAVAKRECEGVAIGEDKWVNLGDACNRNTPPIIEYADEAQGREGSKLTLPVNCIDDDPVNLTVSGWMSEKTRVLGYSDAGAHSVQVTCTDSFGKSAYGEIKITISNINRAPLFKSIEA